jgi:surface antigen
MIDEDYYAFAQAVQEGNVGVVDFFLRTKIVDSSFVNGLAVGAVYGHLAVVERLLLDSRVDPSDRNNLAILRAAENGHLAVVERLLQDQRVDPSAENNLAVLRAAHNGHLAVVERLLQDKRVDPSAENNLAVRSAARFGHLAVVDRLLQEECVDPSVDDNDAVRWAAWNGYVAIVHRLLEDDRVDITVAIQHSCPAHLKRFECRERMTEICIGLQDMQLPAWVTIKILNAVLPRSTLQLHSKWDLVCAVKHFRDKRQGV